jgi:hypothetical protein
VPCEFYQGASEAEKNVPVADHEDIEADYMSEGTEEAGLGDREDPGARAPADADGVALRGTRFWTFARPLEYYTTVFKVLAKPQQRDTAVSLTTTGCPTAALALDALGCSRVIVHTPGPSQYQLWHSERFAVDWLMQRFEVPGGRGAISAGPSLPAQLQFIMVQALESQVAVWEVVTQPGQPLSGIDTVGALKLRPLYVTEPYCSAPTAGCPCVTLDSWCHSGAR